MSMLQDPDMKEVVQDFCKESDEIFSGLEELLEEYEDAPNPSILEEFGQRIDRVMGAAKSIEANTMGSFCELGKTISYKASQTLDEKLLDIVVAILFDTVEILQKVNAKVKTDQVEDVDNLNLDAFSSRLQWIANKFKDIQRASVEIEATTDDHKSIDDLLAELGL